MGYTCIPQADCVGPDVAMNPYCLSPDCESLANCLSCSDIRCVECSTGFTLSASSNECEPFQAD